MPGLSRLVTGLALHSLSLRLEPMTARDLGWSDFFESHFEKCAKPGWLPARLSRETVINYTAILHDGSEVDCVLAGRLWHAAENDAELPAVGDWVAVELGAGDDDENVVRARLPRRTCFSRKAPGKTSEEQVIAANVDLVVVVTEPGPDFNLRRLERFITLIKRSGAAPLILLNKSDLYSAEKNAEALRLVRNLDPEVPVELTSAATAGGLEILREKLTPGLSLTLVGSSGVGKSTLVNQLLGQELLWTGEVNGVTGKGRHTTTARELVPLPGGGLLIDNPGIREVQMWVNEATLRESFSDVEQLALRCKFRDCKHGTDAGCAIREAVQTGTLEEARYEGFLRLDEEIAELERRRKKRQVNIERRAKRGNRIQARNLRDRIQLEKDERGEL